MVKFDVNAVKAQFPALADESLVYLDSAATTQKPQAVIEAITQYYSSQNANVHRGSHSLTAHATNRFEQAREIVRQFIGAASVKEIVWTRGATEALNLIAQTWARSTLSKGDTILVGESEHHANIVPWQIVAEQTGASVVKIPVKRDGHLCQETYQSLLDEDRVKMVAVAHITNVTGSRNPIESMIKLAHEAGAKVVVDGSQGIVHEKLDLVMLDADFYVFSGHKIYAPTGIGVLYGKRELLETMPPWHGGGKMVQKVSFEGTTYSELPGKFEAGTPNIAGAIALAEAINWYQQFDITAIEQHISDLQQLTYTKLCELDDIEIIGYQKGASVISFVMDGVHHQDIATLLDKQGIAVRSGHHCAHPLMDAFGIKGTVRVSFGVYNTVEDVERFVAGVVKAVGIL
ncbi:cysteine desulfurase [Vibrio sp. JC009]|uniref:aminotransferase class V-fold PLP-dependent enzyme n=1 Tax=Vibrio sp. JC009 TaxID=2912314 RepID=UPI0023B17117|nr:cysteine desulfurase [Vibrio sp. JC009]WED23269.1 cysteine desulfurase [Vibrio sp. JC009]